ncbi:hypothetical protein D3C78_1422080 [compost metagenome]
MLLAEAEHIELAEIEMHHLIAEGGGRIVFQIDDNRQMTNFARAVQRFWRGGRQAQREVVRHIGHQFLQFCGIAQVAALDVQTGFRRQQPVEIGPGHQLVEVAVIFQRLMADDRVHGRCLVIKIPAGAVGTANRHVNKGQVVF